jgi:hypothetical protein
MEPHKLNKFDIENIVIFNDELKKFLYDIVDTITYFIDEDEPTFGSISINFSYNNYSFDLYNDDDMRKISIINKNNHHYEFFYENHEEILIKKCKFKNVSIDEITDLLKQLYLCIKN